jgi:hypothetical protein
MDEERTKILGQVAEGEITAEEAARLLDAIETDRQDENKTQVGFGEGDEETVIIDHSVTEVERSFDVQQGGKLTVETDIGSIKVKTADEDTVSLRIDAEHEEDHGNELKIILHNNGKDLHIKGRLTREGDRPWRRGDPGIHAKYYLTVPKKYDVDLKSSGGSISVDSLEGEVLSKTSGGSLYMGNIKGPVIGKTSGGSISLEGCVGTAEVKTSGGGIKIGEVDGEVVAHTSGGPISIDKACGNVSAKTSGGSINVNEVLGGIQAKTSGGSVSATLSKQPEHDCTLATSGGSIGVRLIESVALDLDAKTSGGKISSEFSAETNKSGNKMRGKINGGGPLLTLRTSGGGISVNKLRAR